MPYWENWIKPPQRTISLLNAAGGAMPIPAAPVAENFPISPSISPLPTQTTSTQQKSSDREAWAEIYNKKDVNDIMEEIKEELSGGEGTDTGPPAPGDFSGLTPSFTSPGFWGGFTPSYAQKTGSFWGDLAKSLNTTLGSLQSMKDFAKIGFMMGMHPLGVALAPFGFLSLTEKSSLNPVNNPQVRGALMEVFEQSPIAKSVFGSKKAFEGFLSGMFGYGSSLKGITEPKNLSSYFNELLGYTPTKTQLENMRVNAMDTVRGLGMALAPQTNKAFTSYKDFINNVRSFGWFDAYPSFTDFARAFDISTTIGLSPRETAIAYTTGFFDKFNINDILSNPQEIASQVKEYVSDLAMRADLQRAVEKARSNPDKIDEALKEMLAAYETREKARKTDLSYFEAKELQEKAIESITDAILGELASGHLGGVSAVDAIASGLTGGLGGISAVDSALSALGLGGGGEGISAEAEVSGGGLGMGAEGGFSADLGGIGGENDNDNDNERGGEG